MDNTQIIDLFRENLESSVRMLAVKPGPPELGGPDQQHIAISFKLYGDFEYGPWARKAVLYLAKSACNFPNRLQFFQLDDPKRDCPYRIIEDPEICIREYQMPLKETWTEPAEDLNEEQRKAFVPRMKWPDCTKVVFEIVFTFGL